MRRHGIAALFLLSNHTGCLVLQVGKEDYEFITHVSTISGMQDASAQCFT